MAYTFVGDLHAKPDNLDKVNKLFKIIEELGNPVIMLGDTLDSREIVRGRCLNTIYDNLKASKLEWIILIGNHDQFNNHTSEHSLHTLNALKHVTIVDRPLVKDKTLFMPYTHNLEDFRRFLGVFKDCYGLVCHAAIRNFDYGSGVKELHGIDRKELGHFKWVVSGHFHGFQREDNITYLGTPFSHSFGETEPIKYIGIGDLDNGITKLIPTDFPHHITNYYDVDATEIHELIEKSLKMYENPKDYYRVVLEGSTENINIWAKKFKPYPSVKLVLKPTSVIKSLEIQEDQSNEVKFTTWASNIKKLDDETKQLGLSILNDCRS